ncbi:hypothetical protein M378DRAFT_155880 [Amanita muscaria Koide BX008]|uniref:Small ribosomal subunit protein mS35 mitochondrial conserved domain-containing protein n=1 Tax=Amanita muscaria (strain Koide BX008) TaxID=946122 RepID=A0A0C2TUG1_AMAMK|nr:hypothetical protein M378DRAFT_155880 [Amanita muscaria Koide BX008]
MTFSFARLARVSLPCRQFSSSAPSFARRSKLDELFNHDAAFDLLDDDFDGDDASSGGHLMLREQRQTLHYLRLIEHEMPKLVAFRKPFVPPTAETPVIVRSIDYGGEEHPATAKRAIVVPVDQLPLKDEDAAHKLKLLAGPRWTPNPPADAGVSGLEVWGNGYIKISCEDFPKAAQNLKWASDTLDRLIVEANAGTGDKFSDVPLDVRHVCAKARKAKKGEHLRDRVLNRPSILDFPKEWLPPRNSENVS